MVHKDNCLFWDFVLHQKLWSSGGERLYKHYTTRTRQYDFRIQIVQISEYLSVQHILIMYMTDNWQNHTTSTN